MALPDKLRPSWVESWSKLDKVIEAVTVLSWVSAGGFACLTTPVKNSCKFKMKTENEKDHWEKSGPSRTMVTEVVVESPHEISIVPLKEKLIIGKAYKQVKIVSIFLDLYL